MFHNQPRFLFIPFYFFQLFVFRSNLIPFNSFHFILAVIDIYSLFSSLVSSYIILLLLLSISYDYYCYQLFYINNPYKLFERKGRTVRDARWETDWERLSWRKRKGRDGQKELTGRRKWKENWWNIDQIDKKNGQIDETLI